MSDYDEINWKYISVLISYLALYNMAVPSIIVDAGK
jgi:hypothetical protein